MRPTPVRTGPMLVALALALAACGGGGTLESTTTSTQPAVTTTAASTTTTTVPGTTTTSTTTTTIPGGDALAEDGDKGETVAAVQHLLNCGGFGDLTVDGSFGPATLAAVEAAQEALGFVQDGVVGDIMFSVLSRACSLRRALDVADETTVVGSAAPDDPEVYEISLQAGTSVAVDATPAEGITVTLRTAEGFEVEPPDELTPTLWVIEVGGTHLLQVEAEEETLFELEVTISDTILPTGAWIMGTDRLTYGSTTLEIGDDAQTVIDEVVDILGHGVRGAYAEFDTGWTEQPGAIGLRGVFIEGMAFLFYGPSTDYPAQPERLARIRFEGPSDDASGEARPDHYVTTAEGITVGDTLSELKAAYGSKVKSGSNDDEHYYRFTDSNGELCFYFGASAPTDASAIREMATECRD
ncbi:MAG: peptidoglycan-binding protein [Actinobacteria bacterium]|nr:peptidoglycan-binding protein [Actinomycetota bacterium]